VSARRLTRRSFLLAGAGALAGGLARPAGTLALGRAPARPRLTERFLGEVAPGRLRIGLEAGADLVGLEWHAPASARLQLRVRGSAGRWSEWVSAAGCGAWIEGGAGAAQARRVIGAPVWSAGASALELRTRLKLSGVYLRAVDVSGGRGARSLALARGLLGSASALAPAAALPALGAGQPPIIARRAWGQGMAAPRAAPAYGAVRMAFVHHTQTPNGYLAGEVPAMLRAIFFYHRDVRGWNDIGYNFAIDAFGRIFEARAGGIAEPVVGAQAGGFNLESTGVAVLGSFSSARISAAAAQALEALLAWKLSLHGVPADGRALVRVNPAGAIYTRFAPGAHVSLPHIAGHRDGDSTDCPGDALYAQLASLREGVRQLAPVAARATLALAAAAPPAAGAPPAQAGSQLTGSLTLLDGSPVAGAQVELQLRGSARRGRAVSERTIALARTDAAGNWSLALAAAGPARRAGWLRALYAGGQPATARAAVSEPLHVPAAVIGSLEALPPTQAVSAPHAP
jgi:N-acetylmuramoyl-L-alanine amidase